MHRGEQMAFNPTYHKTICWLTCLYAQELGAQRPAFVIQGKDIVTLVASVAQVTASAALARLEIRESGNDRHYKPAYLLALQSYGPVVGQFVNSLIGKRNDDASAAVTLASIITATGSIYDPFNLHLWVWPPQLPPIVPIPQPPAPPQRPNWMGDRATFLGSIRLCDLVLPGTHDSATSDITAGSTIDPNAEMGSYTFIQNIPYLAPGANSIIANWARNQAFDIATQLSAGIRYFDLRVSEQNGSYWTVHSMFGTLLSSVLQQVSRFLAAHPREIVLLDFNHLYGIQDAGRLGSYILGQLGGRIAPGNRYSPSSKVQELWANNHQAIVLFKDDAAVAAHPELWSQGRIASPWEKDKMGDLQALHDFLDSGLSKRDANRFFVSQGILDPGLAPIKGAVMSPSSIAEFAQANTPQIFDWFRGWVYRLLNVVIIDWFTIVPDYVDTLIEMNLDGAIVRSRIDVDDQDGGADFRSFGFQSSGTAAGATLELTFPGSGPVDIALTPRNGPMPIQNFDARVKPSGRLVFTTLRAAQFSNLSTERAFITFDGTLSTYHPLTVTSAILAVLGPPPAPVETPYVQGYVKHCEFLVDDQGGGSDNRLFTFDTVRKGDGVTVTITYPGSGPASFDLTKANPQQTVPDNAARVKPTGTLVLEWSVLPGEDLLLVLFSGTLHTMHSVTLDRIGVAILGPRD